MNTQWLKKKLDIGKKLIKTDEDIMTTAEKICMKKLQWHDI